MFPVATESASGQCMTPGPTDVCKVPTPGGPVPTPMPNMGQCSNATGSGKVKADNKGVLHKDDQLKMSMGDEAGVAMGVQSNMIKGPIKIKTSNATGVKADGKQVAHATSVTEHNKGNSPPGVQGTPCQTGVIVGAGAGAGSENMSAGDGSASGGGGGGGGGGDGSGKGKGKNDDKKKKCDKKLSPEQKKKLRGKTPSDELRDKYRNQPCQVCGNTPSSPDHIVPVSIIQKMPGFPCMSEQNQEAMLNNPINFAPLCRS
jgi:hypothetical protein